MNTQLASATRNNSERFPELDGVRGIAALAIVAWHYIPSIAVREPGTVISYLDRLLSLCWSGVDLFFVLSGFLIGSILLREKGSPRYFSTFYARRAARIVPLYLVVLAILGAGGWWLKLGAPAIVHPMFANTLPWWSYFCFAQNLFMPGIDDFGPHIIAATWSLAVEEQFYLILPLLIYVTPRQVLPWILGLFCLTAPMLRALVPPGMATYVLLPARLDSLMSGVLLAWVWSTERGRFWLRAHHTWLAVAWALIAIYASIVLKRGAGLWELRASHGWLVNSWLAVWFASTLALILSKPNLYGGPFRWGPLRTAGSIAFGIYLLHGPILHFCHYLFLGTPAALHDLKTFATTLVAACLSFLAASASYRWIELPCLRLGHRFTYSDEKNPTRGD